MRLDQLIAGIPTATAVAAVATAAALEQAGVPIDPDSWHLSDVTAEHANYPLVAALLEYRPRQHRQQLLIGRNRAGNWAAVIATVWAEPDGKYNGKPLLRAKADSPAELAAAVQRALLDQ